MLLCLGSLRKCHIWSIPRCNSMSSSFTPKISIPSSVMIASSVLAHDPIRESSIVAISNSVWEIHQESQSTYFGERRSCEQNIKTEIFLIYRMM
uniref:Uncharacterized protein n=1 Tax=Arundo donax TaxID=35708 RepID=A0A0A9TG22_ARUDO